MTDLYHYTCSHGRVEMGSVARLLPIADRADVSSLGLNAWPAHFVWLTDRPEPDEDALGLTRNFIACDRTAHRYRVTDDSTAVRWLDFIAHEPGYASVASLLESPGADPSAWWVSRDPVPVVYDPLGDIERVSRIVAARWPL